MNDERAGLCYFHLSAWFEYAKPVQLKNAGRVGETDYSWWLATLDYPDDVLLGPARARRL